MEKGTRGVANETRPPCSCDRFRTGEFYSHYHHKKGSVLHTRRDGIETGTLDYLFADKPKKERGEPNTYYADEGGIDRGNAAPEQQCTDDLANKAGNDFFKKQRRKCELKN